MYLKIVFATALLAVTFPSQAVCEPEIVPDPNSTVVVQEFSSSNARHPAALGWDDEQAPKIYVHFFSGPVDSPDYPATMKSTGHVISRLVSGEDEPVIDEIWRRPVSLIHMRGPASGEDGPQRISVASWDKQGSALTIVYVLSTASETYVNIDRLTVDMTDPQDWVAERVAVQSKLIQTDMDGGVFQSCSIRQGDGGRPVVDLIRGEHKREIEFSEFRDMLPTVRDTRPDYKILYNIENLPDRIAENFSDQ